MLIPLSQAKGGECCISSVDHRGVAAPVAHLHDLGDRDAEGEQGAVPQLVEGREEAVGEDRQGHVLQQGVGRPRLLTICSRGTYLRVDA